MSRYIKTDALMEDIGSLYRDEDHTDYNVAIADALDVIDEQPTADVPQWIPCSERLPEDIRPVIVTWKNNDPKSYYQYIVGKHFIGTAHYKNGTWFWYSSTTEDMLAEYGRCDSEEFDEAIEVIAWMPLPNPWKGEADEQIRCHRTDCYRGTQERGISCDIETSRSKCNSRCG